jgi:hypothetical protein
MKAAAIGLFLSLMPLPATSFTVDSDDKGGIPDAYYGRMQRARATGELIRIGPVACDSSCTLYLGARNVCVSPEAVFGFHAVWTGWQGNPVGSFNNQRWTALFADAYKPRLRELFLSHVREYWHVSPQPLMKLTGSQLSHYGYRLCE